MYPWWGREVSMIIFLALDLHCFSKNGWKRIPRDSLHYSQHFPHIVPVAHFSLHVTQRYSWLKCSLLCFCRTSLPHCPWCYSVHRVCEVIRAVHHREPCAVPPTPSVFTWWCWFGLIHWGLNCPLVHLKGSTYCYPNCFCCSNVGVALAKMLK